MPEDNRLSSWIASYRTLAEKIVADQVKGMQEDFPDERFPVRPPYRKAMYQRVVLIVDELNRKMKELLDESPDETDPLLQKELMALQESYEQDFIRQVHKSDERTGGDE